VVLLQAAATPFLRIPRLAEQCRGPRCSVNPPNESAIVKMAFSSCCSVCKTPPLLLSRPDCVIHKCKTPPLLLFGLACLPVCLVLGPLWWFTGMCLATSLSPADSFGHQQGHYCPSQIYLAIALNGFKYVPVPPSGRLIGGVHLVFFLDADRVHGRLPGSSHHVPGMLPLLDVITAVGVASSRFSRRSLTLSCSWCKEGLGPPLLLLLLCDRCALLSLGRRLLGPAFWHSSS